MKILFSVVFLFSFNLWAQSLKPGLWKSTGNFKINGVPVPEAKDENCVRSDDVKDIKATVTELLNEKGCKLSKWIFKGKNIEAGISCKSAELDATGSLKGQVSEKNYHLDGKAEGTFQGMLPATATIQLKGQWLKACQ